MENGQHKIIPLVIAKSRGYISDITHLRNRGQIHDRNVYIWYIEGPEKDIIVDAGGAEENLKELDLESKQEQDLEGALGKVGLSPSDIDIAIITHAHHDHLWHANELTNAEILIQESELEAAKNPHPISYFAYEPIQGILDKVDFKTIQGDEKIVEGVEVIKTPGHSAGGQSVLVDTEEGKVAITGFCSVEKNFEPPEKVKRVMPFIVPTIHTDPIMAYESMKRIKEIGDILIPIHEAKYENVGEIP